MALARSHFSAGRLEEATEEYVWLWNHMVEYQPAAYGVRHSFLVYELQRLVATHRPARERFTTIRDAVAPRDEGAPDPKALTDWLCLNIVLVQEAESLHWYERVVRSSALDQRIAWLLETFILPILLREERWAEAGALYSKPLARIAQARLMRMAEWRTAAGHLVRALRAAGRLEEAVAVAAEARSLDGSAKLDAVLVEVERVD